MVKIVRTHITTEDVHFVLQSYCTCCKLKNSLQISSLILHDVIGLVQSHRGKAQQLKHVVTLRLISKATIPTDSLILMSLTRPSLR